MTSSLRTHITCAGKSYSSSPPSPVRFLLTTFVAFSFTFFPFSLALIPVSDSLTNPGASSPSHSILAHTTSYVLWMCENICGTLPICFGESTLEEEGEERSLERRVDGIDVKSARGAESVSESEPDGVCWVGGGDGRSRVGNSHSPARRPKQRRFNY